jgi:hypothetical protein
MLEHNSSGVSAADQHGLQTTMGTRKGLFEALRAYPIMLG